MVAKKKGRARHRIRKSFVMMDILTGMEGTEASSLRKPFGKKTKITLCNRMKMAPGEIPQGAGEPYVWDESVLVTPQAQQMWKDVATGIDRNQTGADSYLATVERNRNLCGIVLTTFRSGVHRPPFVLVVLSNSLNW